MKSFLIRSPIFRHFDLKLIGNQISIKKEPFYYLNKSKFFRINLNAFKTKEYSKINHDKNLFYDKQKKKYFRRSQILSKIIQKKFKNKSIKILDYGCNQGFLLKKLRELNYSNLFGFDINTNYENCFIKSKIKYLKKIGKHKFDLIIFSHSISYAKNLDKLFARIKKILNKKSYLLINLQDVSKRPINFLYGDQKYHFNKNMIKNYFGKYGEIKFLKVTSLSHEIVFFLKFKIKKKKEIIKTSTKEIIRINCILNKVKAIKNPCLVFGKNLMSALCINLLKRKVKGVISNTTDSQKFFNKKIINMKLIKNESNIPVICMQSNFSFLKNNFKLIKL